MQAILDAGFDIHRSQITFEELDHESGEIRLGRIDATPQAVSAWAARHPDRDIRVALEACTGWYFVARALEDAGATPHLAEVAETSALRGRKRRAKTDRADARWLRSLLTEGRLPEAWIGPDHILELRTKTRLRHTLSTERSAWRTRLQAALFHVGAPSLPLRLSGERAREWIAEHDLAIGMERRVAVALSMMEAIDTQLVPLEAELRDYARRQAGCKALMGHFGIGELIAPVIVAELGDMRRLRRSRQAVRMAGLDVAVHRSDTRGRLGRLTKQGSPELRWALYEAAQSACRRTSPDHADLLALKERGLTHTQATLTIARKLTRRCFHTLRELGEEAMAPA